MPTYLYKDTETGHLFEERQSIHDDALTVSPYTGNPVVRVIGKNVAAHFKGSGFYTTDKNKKE